MSNHLQRIHEVFHFWREAVKRAWCLSELPQPLEIASLPIVCHQYSNLVALQMVSKSVEKPWPDKIHTIFPYDLGVVFSEAMDSGGLPIPDYWGSWGGAPAGPSAAALLVARTTKSLLSLFLFMVPLTFFSQVAKWTHKY